MRRLRLDKSAGVAANDGGSMSFLSNLDASTVGGTTAPQLRLQATDGFFQIVAFDAHIIRDESRRGARILRHLMLVTAIGDVTACGRSGS